MISYMTHASGPGCISKYLVSIFSDIQEGICQEIGSAMIQHSAPKHAVSLLQTHRRAEEALI